MKPYFLAPALLFLAACQHNADSEVATTPAETPVQTTTAEAASPERIEASMITVNGKPRAELSTKELTSLLGRPDSISKGVVECGGELETTDNSIGDFWYYGKTRYEVANPKAILASFDVTAGKFQGQLGKLTLNQNTTLEDVRRVYPAAAKEAEEGAKGQPELILRLPFYEKDVQMDASLNLIFKQGHLQEVEFFNPC